MRASSLAIVASVLLAFATAPAFAFETKPYDQAAFTAAQKAGKSVVIDVSAPWCPTCKAQHQVFKTLETKPEYKDVTVLSVDFDSQKDVLKSLKVQSQSTLIAYKGATETGRTVGDTKAGSIEALVASSVK